MSRDIIALRHSAAHLLAHAISQLYPDTLLTIGPATPEGFFYDLLPTRNFKEEDLPLILERMKQLATQDYALEHRQISKDEAREIFKHNPFKLELIDQIPGDTVGLATQGDFYDLCKGGHVARTSELHHIALTGISGSYWRADRANQPLQRISGVVFHTAQELTDHFARLEELALYDHRRLGKQMELFSFHEEGVGFPFFHPKGMVVLNTMMDWMRRIQRTYQYQEIRTPVMLSDSLWRRSGHYAHYKDKMYFSMVDDEPHAIKPMNCPGSLLVYGSRPRSYRELPLKLAEYGLCHRHELSGVLHGLTRVRAFTQDDAHIYCTPEQLEEQIVQVLTIITTMLQEFGLTDYQFAISTRPDDSMGSPELWETATQALKNALTTQGHAYTIKEGEGAFYGPKIEVVIKDSMGRSWQCSTAQVDFFQPENFDIWYTKPDGTRARPVIIHQAIYGSLERFFGIVLEHYKGQLPLWLSPVHVRVLTVTDDQKSYGQELVSYLTQQGVRAELDTTSDPLSGQIKRAQLDKVAAMIVVGKREAELRHVTIRERSGAQKTGLTWDEVRSWFITQNPLHGPFVS